MPMLTPDSITSRVRRAELYTANGGDPTCRFCDESMEGYTTIVVKVRLENDIEVTAEGHAFCVLTKIALTNTS